MPITQQLRSSMDGLRDTFASSLGDNLESLVLYGSSVRNDFSRGSSDINLLIVLKQNTAAAQRSISQTIRDSGLNISPLVLSSKGLDRSMQAFALKFSDIARRDELLYGTDPFSGFEVSIPRRQFLLEQGLRNSWMRLGNAYIQNTDQPERYLRILRGAVPRIFADLAELLRLEGSEVPDERRLQAPLLARELGIEQALLDTLIGLREGSDRSADIHELHRQLLDVLQGALDYMAGRWEL
ncbi:MAG: hypothetical protein H7A35_11240 [Planctomycetales bacterium]|nr:hypothetical protein [bacterium]UNM07437.1 MAG: hypothetical protein H7A35_11240 [Planctomycetales bacterium]